MKVHHIGIIVKDIIKSIKIYSKLGYKTITDIIIDQNQNNKVVFIQSSDYSQIIELIEPINETSSIYNFKEGYHHICYEIKTEENIFIKFKEMEIGKIFTKPIKSPAINNREIIFAYLRNGTFVEFIL